MAETERVLAVIDELLELTEAQLPANAKSPVNAKLRIHLDKVLRAYFRKLLRAFPYSKLGAIYNKNVTESVSRDADKILDPMLKTFRSTLEVSLNGWTAAAYLQGDAQMITWGKTKGGIPIAYEGPPIKRATDYAKAHVGRFIKSFDQETKRRLAQTIGEGIKSKAGIPKLSREIKRDFADMTRFRANMIARTETNDALSQAFMDRSHDMGITGKEWVTSDPCEICEENEAEGIVPLAHVFASGHDRPPAHPNCECALAPARYSL